MANSNTDIKIRQFSINLPDESSKQFYIFHDLAELFGKEFQSEAVSLLTAKLKLIEDLTPMPSIDYEADRTSIRTVSPDTIYNVARVIEELSILANESTINENQWASILERLKNWKRPKPKKWKVGDIFSIRLNDGSYAFGQALTKPVKSWMAPTFALFDLKAESEAIDINQLKQIRPLTILHLMDMNLKNGKWKIIGSLDKILCDPYSGPWRDNLKSGSPGILESVANYYWFNTHNYKDVKQLTELIMKKENFFDKMKKYWS